MDVFVTGATGVLGRSVVPLLIAAGHRVRALARSEANVATLRALGAEPVRADLFDAASLRAAVAGSDAIVHLATSIPPTNASARAEAWQANDRMRAEGARHLVDAALATGVSTVIYPSASFLYPDSGAAWLSADTTPPDPPTVMRSSLVAEEEVARFTAAGGRGIVLRLGAFYGPQAPSTHEMLAMARRGLSGLVGAGDSYQPLIWVDDAAAAVMTALHDTVPAGVYDVVDDEPLRRSELTTALAQSVGYAWLLRPPLWLARRMMGVGGEALGRSQRVSNRRFKEVSGWTPAVPNARVGLARLAAAGTTVTGTPPRHVGWVVAGLVFLALVAWQAGLWQQFAPHSFYHDFPGLGWRWVAVDGPFNEHLLRDVGGGNLALAVVALVALLRPTVTLIRAVALATLVAQVPHFVYHLLHLDLIPTPIEQVVQTLTLTLLVVVPAFLLWAVTRWGERATPAHAMQEPRSRALPHPDEPAGQALG